MTIDDRQERSVSRNRNVVGIVSSSIRQWLERIRSFLRRLFGGKASMETRNLRLGHHLVAFLDVLGQSERFKKLRLPATLEEHAEVGEVVRQTAGFVLDLRKAFDEQFRAFEAGSPNMHRHTKKPLRPNFIGISDSLITSVPLRNDGGDLVGIVTVYSALSAAAVVMLMALATKHALRGGIDVGLAVEMGPQEVYGTALARAYHLESKEAQYPRIVIGDELWRYFNAAIAQFEKQTTPVGRSITAIAKKTMELVAMDADGKRILDYLGQTMVDNAAPGGNHRDYIVRPAYEFVLAEQSRIRATGDAKLIERYDLFRKYFESRLPLWGIAMTKS